MKKPAFNKWNGSQHTPVLKSRRYVRNLRRLARGLLQFDGPSEFSMDVYYMYHGSLRAVPDKYDCATTACALGHAPLLTGIPNDFDDEHSRVSWHSYCCKHFIPHDEHYETNFDWCFGAQWSSVDNTARGAGLRILYMLEHGAPYRGHSGVEIEHPTMKDKYIYWQEE